MKKSLTLLIIFALVSVGSMSAQAADLQIDYMMLEADIEDLEYEPTALQLKFISPVGPNVDVMGVAAIGISDDEIKEFDPFFGTVSLSVDLASMFGIYGRAHSDLGANARFFVQAGFVLLDYDLDAEIFGESGSESYDDTGLAFGFGVSFDVSDQAAIVIEYNQFPDVDVEGEFEIETTSLSVGFQMFLD